MATLDELLKPISADSFCGEDGSYELEYEEAKREIDKLSENNFDLIRKNSELLLLQKSKDMRALGYLVLSTAMTEGMDAFAVTVQAYCQLVQEHWDDIHPKRPEARANALKWLNEERSHTLISNQSSQGNYEGLLAAVDALGKLKTFCEGKFENPPSFSAFTKLVQGLAEKNKPKPVPEPGTAPSGGGSSAPATAADATIASADDAVIAVQKAVFFLNEENRANPLPYRLLRILKWEQVRAAPPSEAGKTMVPVPYSEALDAFRNLFQQKQWPDLIKNGEEAFSGDNMIFWFDLQRFICAGLQAQGGDSMACAKAIMGEMALLLARVPEVANLAFDDGTPFADTMTREWIQNDVKSVLGGSGGPAPVKKKGDVGEEQKKAEALFGEGKFEQALNVLRTGLANDSSEKNNFDRKLILADLCFKGNKPQIAKAVLEDLIAIMDRYTLVRWDTELCVSVYLLAQKVYLSLAEASEDGLKAGLREKAVQMHSQISKLDPFLAISADFK